VISGSVFLDWAIFASSLINLILLLWLGLTVLLNAETRSAGVWLVGGTALLGSAFFVAHTAILGISGNILVRSLDFWWQLGWAPLVAIPFAWYWMTLWFSGFWGAPSGTLRRRHRIAVWVTIVLLLVLIGQFAFTRPLPSFQQTLALQFASVATVGGVPVLLLTYPVYIVACIGLAFDALRHPSPSPRTAGDEARRRAQPWLLATSLTLFIVSLVVAITIGLIVLGARTGLNSAGADFAMLRLTTAISRLDLALALLITLATILIGQAIVSYELVIGRVLPRGELGRHWRNAILLAVGFGIIVGGSVAWHLRFIYSVLLATLLMTVFYALFGWRTFLQQEELMRRLRPFVASQRLADHLLDPNTQIDAPPQIGISPAPEIEPVAAPFHTLCRDVLRTEQALLAAVGSLAPLVEPHLVYPPGAPLNELPLHILTGRLRTTQAALVAIDEAGLPAMHWAVPLWSARGLIGVLLLGRKHDGGLYTQEEIDLGRATGERLIDARASAAIAQRLLMLQRQRLAESRLLDRQTRRVLHDEVLPLLHTALLSSGSTPAAPLLVDAHRRIANLLRDLPLHPAPALEDGLLAALRHVVERELAGEFDRVTWEVEPEAEIACAQLSPLTAEVIFYAGREAMRNAARHARGDERSRPLHLAVTVQRQAQAVIAITIADDGSGMSDAHSASGTGQGLALHRDLLAVVGGAMQVDQRPGGGMRVAIRV
jgi:hypothetical protein